MESAFVDLVLVLGEQRQFVQKNSSVVSTGIQPSLHVTSSTPPVETVEEFREEREDRVSIPHLLYIDSNMCRERADIS